MRVVEDPRQELGLSYVPSDMKFYYDNDDDTYSMLYRDPHFGPVMIHDLSREEIHEQSHFYPRSGKQARHQEEERK